ncbi:type I glyceraldehyde-3-phosphate dehydrogenase [Marinomonas algicola]|uniref:type I glyceraldehyde-3-phosphate dehydrogenase n=1 Tax=Marinomonas algicola TaxID=2773454 RepID=UPI00174E550D|nr:glyceraldehyde 3-phosphate dehydrogenase NAD-binding domain-containing protein [Marinomonas algicola]
MLRVAINGYGRIGRSVLRALYENDYRDSIQVVAINELSDLDTISYLTRYDSTHGRFPMSVSCEESSLKVGDDLILCLAESDPDRVDWQSLSIDMLLECSGSFSSRESAQKYINAGVHRMLLSQPADSDVDATIVFGFNESEIEASHTIVSAASCTTNCIIPILEAMEAWVGIEHGTTQTIHSAMNDQPIIDAYHKNDLRLTRSAMSSIIPVDTGLSKGIKRLLPALGSKIACNALRVPTINVSAIDLVIRTKEMVTKEEVNSYFERLSRGKYHNILGFTKEPHASVDFNHDARSVIIDGTQTQVVDGQLVKLLCWFDNEWGYANRMLDVANYWGRKI